MTTLKGSRRQRPARTRTARVVFWSVLGAVLVLIGSAVWVGVRAVKATEALSPLVGLTGQLQAQILAHNSTGAQSSARAIEARADLAASYTSDFVWRAYEKLPFAGPNFAAVAELSGATSALAADVLTPLASLSAEFDDSTFQPKSGVVDLAALTAVQPKIAKIVAAVKRSQATVRAIDTSATISLITSAQSELLHTLTAAEPKINSVNTAARLVPLMLGSAGPRNYLLLIQNPAELRTLGGIPGAFAVIHAESGRIELTKQASTTDFEQFAEPVLPLSAATVGLYGQLPGTFVQDVTMLPRFAEAAALAQEMWRLKTGVTVDGVLAVDPVALGYLLKATGPVTLATGDVLTSGTVVKALLSQVYARYKKPADQDKYFAGAAQAIFTAISAGKVEPGTFLRSLARAGDENRVLIWSSRAAEQAILAPTTLAGGLPVSDSTVRPFGVYFNDSTGGKMDYYLSVKYGLGQSVCRTDQRPGYGLDITLSNTAPPTAAKTLSPYVTGGNHFGVAPGNIRTNLAIYVPIGVRTVKATRDGAPLNYTSGADGKQQVAGIIVELEPGQTTALHFDYLSNSPSRAEASIVSTPLIVTKPIDKIVVGC